MKQTMESLSENGSAWLPILTLLALATNAAVSIRQAHVDRDNRDWRIHRECHLTGLRYYLRKRRDTGILDILSEMDSVAHFDAP